MRAVECAKQIGELSGSRTFVGVCVPPDEAHRSDARPVRPREIKGSRAGGLGEISAHAGYPWRRGLAAIECSNAGTARKLRKANSLLESPRQPGIGVAVEIQKPCLRVLARWQHLLWCPGHHGRWPADNQRCDRSDREASPTPRIDATARCKSKQRPVEPAA